VPLLRGFHAINQGMLLRASGQAEGEELFILLGITGLII
jgi:hypothetical protein